MTDGLQRSLRPRSIAVIGGGAWCANVIEQCRKVGFDGDIWPVHPKRDEVGGLTAYRDVSDLPGAPDASFIGVNRTATVDVLRTLSAAGAGGAVCFASGFRESQAETGDGADLEAALLDAAGEMTILGPNCYGLINYLDGAALWPDIHGGVRVERGVALIAQSSNIAINLTMQARGLPVAYVVTAGNQAQTGMSEIGQALLADDRVTALGMYVEGFDNLRAWEALSAEAKRLGKSVVVLKVGRSAQAQAATVSHTASLAGSDAGARALLKRLGIGQATSLAGLLEALKILHVMGAPLSSNRIASMSCSGGEASLMADAAHDFDLEYPALNAAQNDGLRAALGPKVALANPLDYHTYIWGDEDAMAATFTAMMAADLALGCVVLDFPRADRCEAPDWDTVIRSVARAQAASGRQMAILASLAETMPEDVADRLVAMGIIPFSGMSEAMEAMEIVSSLGRANSTSEPLLLPVATDPGATLSEAEAKAALSPFGVRVPRSMRAKSVAEACAAASDVGFPLVLKGEGIAHKTEAGAVALGLMSVDAVRNAAEAMPTEHFLLEEMMSGTVAELLIGVVLDPAHGYVLTLAAGGTLTELLEDGTSMLVPTPRDEVADALQTIKIFRVLEGYRGKPGADLDAVLDAVMAVQAYVAAERPQEVEINPLICTPEGAIAVDALIRTGGGADV